MRNPFKPVTVRIKPAKNKASTWLRSQETHKSMLDGAACPAIISPRRAKRGSRKHALLARSMEAPATRKTRWPRRRNSYRELPLHHRPDRLLDPRTGAVHIFGTGKIRQSSYNGRA
jgi:hypothetical protein